MKKRRVWTEFLAPEILAAPETLALLRRYQLQPIIAMPPGREGEMAQALAALQRSGVDFGLWPLLHDSEGYWPGAANAGLVRERVRELLRFAEEGGLGIQTMAIDLEPTLARKQTFAKASGWQRARLLGERLRESRRPEDRHQQAQGAEVYAQMAAELRDAGIETLAIAVPPLAIDLVSGGEGWQRFFGTPLTGPRWDRQSPMYYRSMIEAALPGQSRLWGRAIFAEACRIWAHGEAPACMSLGVVGPGKLAHETSYASPSELAWDVACATEAGLEDLALFSLESVLGRADPEAWLAAFSEAPRALEVPRRERLARRGLRGVVAAAALASRWF